MTSPGATPEGRVLALGRIWGIAGPAARTGGREFVESLGNLECRTGRRTGPRVSLGPEYLLTDGAALAGQGPGLTHQSPDGRYHCAVDGRLVAPGRQVSHLAAKGFAAQGDSPAEVLLSSYLHNGVLALKHFRGSFAFAIYDAKEQRLVLGVDPYGTKRLFVAARTDGLLFASDLGALAKSGLVDGGISQAGLVEYFSFGYISPPLTIYQDISALEVGEYLVYERGTVHREHYHKVIADRWEFADVRGQSEDDLLDRLDALTIDAVTARLPESSSVAAYLSSGLDTGLLAACLSRHGGKHIVAYTLGTHNPRHDEVPGARRMAGHLGIKDHHCVYLQEDECFAALEALPDIFGQPMADISAIPNQVITAKVAESFDEVVAGDGPDGLYGNWDLRPWHYYYRWTPYLLRKPAAAILEAADRKLQLGLSTPSRQIGDLLAQPQFSWVFHKKLKAGQLEALLGRQVPADTFAVARYLRDRKDIPLYERLRMAFALFFVMHGVLQKGVGIHNANLVEQVCPYYDRDLVDYICALPTRFKTRGKGYGKYLHKKLIQRYVPPEVFAGPKRGFIFDIREFDPARLRSLTDTYLNPARIQDAGLLDPGFVRTCTEGYLRGDDRMGPAVWSLLVFEMWRERFGR